MQVRHIIIDKRPAMVPPEHTVNCSGCEPGDPIPGDAILVNSTSELPGSMAWQQEEPYALGTWFSALRRDDTRLEEHFRACEVLDGVWLRFVSVDAYRALCGRYARDMHLRARAEMDRLPDLWAVFIKAVDHYPHIVYERESALHGSQETPWTVEFVLSS